MNRAPLRELVAEELRCMAAEYHVSLKTGRDPFSLHANVFPAFVREEGAKLVAALENCADRIEGRA